MEKFIIMFVSTDFRHLIFSKFESKAQTVYLEVIFPIGFVCCVYCINIIVKYLYNCEICDRSVEWKVSEGVTAASCFFTPMLF